MNTKSKASRILRSGWARVGLALAALVVIGIGAYAIYQATSGRPASPYPTLALDGHQRLLVLAPHCDDETLGSGGLLQAALARGMRVRVVVATAGDGYRHATEMQFNTLSPTSQDYIRLGEMRQQESVDALARLGVAESDATFLTYPEHCLPELWWNHWTSEQPYRSPFTGLDHTTYPRAFRPDAPFSGEAILDDLRAILRSERPDLIILPHPNDMHIDHHTLSILTLVAVAMEEQADPTFRPELVGYLVHYGLYPQPFGLSMEDSLYPPRQLQPLGQWIQWLLPPGAVRAKVAAVREYRSQDRVIGYYLDAFVRRNELFWEVPPIASLSLSGTQVYSESTGAPESVAAATNVPELVPLSNSVIQRIDRAADISGLQMVRQNDGLWVAVEVLGYPSRAHTYNLYVRGFTLEASSTWSAHWGETASDGVKTDGHTVRFPLDLNALGHPTWLAVSAETRGSATLDHSAWFLIRIE